MRLNKYLAECGICSRREADKLIEKGCVAINGRNAVIGSQAEEGDIVTLNGKPIADKNRKVVLAYYKPVGITCTEKDRFAKATVTEAVKYPVRVTYAGRLDKDSEGLLVLTNDGNLIQHMMKAAAFHEKEYRVKTDKEISEAFLEKMRNGIRLEELEQTTRACRAEREGKYTFRIILTQGLNRQIRRMCKACGYEVKSLKRLRVMNIKLENLKPGEYRELQGEELRELYRLAGI